MVAAWYGKLEIVKYIVEVHGVSAVEAKQCAVCPRCDPIAKHEKFFWAHTPSGTSSLAHAAARCGSIPVLEYLRSRGARDNVIDEVV